MFEDFFIEKRLDFYDEYKKLCLIFDVSLWANKSSNWIVFLLGVGREHLSCSSPTFIWGHVHLYTYIYIYLPMRIAQAKMSKTMNDMIEFHLQQIFYILFMKYKYLRLAPYELRSSFIYQSDWLLRITRYFVSSLICILFEIKFL